MIVELANAADPKWVRMSVCVTRSDLEIGGDLRQTTDAFCLGRRSRFDMRGMSFVRRFCEAEAVDVLHIHGRSSLNFVAGLRVLRHLSSRKALLFHDHFGDVYVDKAFPRSMRRALRYLRPLYVGVHPDLTAVAESEVPGLNARTIPNAIDFGRYSRDRLPSTEPVGQPRRGIVIANVRPQKDLETLVLALGSMKDHDWTVDIVGSVADTEYYERCRTLIRRLDLQERVRFVGPSLDVVSTLAGAHFAVLSSRSESGPLALLEYAASSLPFVATRVGLVAEKLALGGLPGFVSPGDVEALSSALVELITLSPGALRQRAELSRQVAASRFDISAAMPAWYEAYDDAVRDNR